MARQEKPLQRETVVRRMAQVRQDRYDEEERHKARRDELEVAFDLLGERCPHLNCITLGRSGLKRCEDCTTVLDDEG